jgi:hypothetical protein
LGFGLIDDAWLLELDDSGAEPTAEWKRVPLPSGQAARFCVRAHFQAAKDGVPGSFIIAGGGPRIRTGPLETDPMKRPQSMFSVLRIPLPE